MKIRVQARNLQPGDVTGSGERVVKVETGVRTPKGKVEVFLRPRILADGIRKAIWGAYTEINVERAQ